MSTTPDFTVMDPLAKRLSAIEPGTLYHLADVYDALIEDGHRFTFEQVKRSNDYLRRSYCLVEYEEAWWGRRRHRGSEWYRWVGSAALYAERRGAAGNYLLGSVQGMEWDDPRRIAHRLAVA